MKRIIKDRNETITSQNLNIGGLATNVSEVMEAAEKILNESNTTTNRVKQEKAKILNTPKLVIPQQYDLPENKEIEILIQMYVLEDIKQHLKDCYMKPRHFAFSAGELVVFDREPDTYLDMYGVERVKNPSSQNISRIRFYELCWNNINGFLIQLKYDFELFISECLNTSFHFIENGIFKVLNITELEKLWNKFISSKNMSCELKWLYMLFWELLKRIIGEAKKQKEKNLKFIFKSFFSKKEKEQIENYIFDLSKEYIELCPEGPEWLEFYERNLNKSKKAKELSEKLFL